jgi:hypothetical protein
MEIDGYKWIKIDGYERIEIDNGKGYKSLDKNRSNRCELQG